MELVKSEKLEKSMQELQFSVDAETFAAAVDKAFRREGKKYTVPGFRKGKAPRHTLEKMYGEDLFHYDAINDLFPQAYEEAVKAAGIEPVGRPEVDVVSASITDGAVLKVTVPVKPEIKVKDYIGLKGEKLVHTVKDAEVEAELSRMQERNGRMITREGAAQNGDTAELDFEGFVDGTAFEGGKAEHYKLALGSGSFIPGFEEQVVGHAAGEEFDITVKFPEDYQAEELAGKEAVFKIKLHEVQTKELPALDDEFAKDVSEYDTLDELRASIRKEKEEQNDKNAEIELENGLVDQLIDSMEGEIPEVMYENRTDDLVREFEYRLAQQGLKLDLYLQYMGQDMKAFREGFKAQAEKQVKIRLALEALAAQEKIEATDEEAEAELQRIADANKLELDKVREVVDIEEVKQDLAVNKAVDLLKEKAEVTTRTVEDTEAKDAEAEKAE